MLKAKRLKNLDRLYSEYIDLFSWWSISAEKLAVTMSIDLVTDIANGAKGSTIPNTLNFLLPFLSLSWTCLSLLSNEVQIFVYSGTSWDCEGIVSSLIYWYSCTGGVRIIVKWRSKPCTEAKETL